MTQTESGPMVVMLGDSLTAGYQLPPAAALPAAVGRALKDEGVSARMINASRGSAARTSVRMRSGRIG